MIDIETFHFLRPQWFIATIPLVLLLWMYVRRNLDSGSWTRVCDKQLLPYLLTGRQKKQSVGMTVLVGLVGVLAIVALAGPAWKQLPQPVFRSQASLVILLDLSRSMDVTDVKPSRLKRAQHKVLDILKKRKEGQTALIVYALEPFIVSPLTQDAKTIASLVNDLSTDLMPYQGSYPDKAVQKAIDLFKQASVLNGQILLITDGIESNKMSDMVIEAKNAGHRLSILGVGTAQGAPIADAEGGFIKDSQGSIVVTKLNEEPLREIAAVGGGRYHALTADDRDINSLIAEFSTSRLSDEFNEEDNKLKVNNDRWREEGPWILLLLLPLVAIVFRKGYLAVIVLFIVPLPEPVNAVDWDQLWKNDNQRAAASFKNGDIDQAAALFTNPQWKAAANYRAEKYEQTLQSLEGVSTPDALYNKGNALAKLGKIPEAIQSYEEALKLNPEHEDAEYNKALLEEFLKQNQQDNPNQQDNQQQNQDQNQGEGQQSNQQNANSQQQGQQSEDKQGENASSGQTADGSDAQQQPSNHREQADADNQDQAQQQSAKAGKEDAQQGKEQNRQQSTPQNEQQDEQQHSTSQLAQQDQQQSESTQAAEQWLRRIPDDPGGLLRRKFRYQSITNRNQAQRESKPW